jgi:hypothetical protein
MVNEIILSQDQMDAIVNASKQNDLETVTLHRFKMASIYELLFEKRENGYYYAVLGKNNHFDSELDNETYEAYMDIINNPVM